MQGRAPTCQPRPPTSSRRSRVRTRERATRARSLSGGGAARALAARARRAALVVVGPCPIEGHCTSETASLLRCKAVLRRASRGLQRAAGLRVCAHAIAPLRSLSLGRRRSTRACGARAPRRAGWSRSMPYGRPLHQRDGLSLGARPCSDVPAAASNEQPACACAHTRSRHCARSLSGGGAARALAARARRAALVGVGPYPMEGHCTSETASPSVQGRAPTCQPRPLRTARLRVCAHAECDRSRESSVTPNSRP